MIGGTDIQIATQAGTDALDIALRLAKRLWPDAIIEDVTTGARQQNLAGFALDQTTELLIYKNLAAASSWDEFGAIPKLDGTLIHVILGHGLLTLTLDDSPNEQLIRYVESMKNALHQTIFNITASSPPPRAAA